MEFEDCHDFSISRLTLRNSPFWTLHPIYCSNVHLTRLWIRSPLDGSAPNTDGIDPDSCSNVTIDDCDIETGDDCIAIKSGWDHHGRNVNRICSDIMIRNCKLTSPRCAALTFGSEMSGGIRNVECKDSVIDGCKQAFHFKTAEGRGGKIYDIVISNCNIKRTDIVIRLNAFYRGARV